ncbi:MAG: NAD(P)H-dependent oxidoreductase [Caulobacteraceae bacterium]
MKYALIVSHPHEQSFTVSVAKTVQAALQARGHEAVLRDLYRMGFDPRLGEGEIPGPHGFEPADDVKAERAVVADAAGFAFVYPVWFNAPPAMLKGYIDRVFGMGFGYGMAEEGGNTPLLNGRSLISFTSSGAPMNWLVETGAWGAMRKLFDEHVANVCGLSVLDHVHFGGVTPNMTPEAAESCLDQVRAVVARRF